MTAGILNKDIMISHEIEIVSSWAIQRTCDHEICGHNNSFSMLVDHIISGICNSIIREVILIGDNTTLLDYGH